MTALARPPARTEAGSLAPRAALLTVVFCVMTGIGMVWSTLTVLATLLGASAMMVGVIVSLFGGARILASFPSGLASERFGRRPLMITGLVFLTLSSLAAVEVASLPMLALFLLAQGLGEGLYLTAAMAAMADLGTPESRVRDMTLYQGVAMVGLSIGPAVGGFTAELRGYGAVFLLQGLLGLFAIATMLGAMPHRRPAAGAPAGAPVIARLAANLRAMSDLATIAFGAYFARISANWVLMPLVARERLGMSIGAIGGLYTVGAIANLLSLPLTDLGARRLGRLPVLLGSTLCMILALVLLATASAPPVVWVAATLMGAAAGLAGPVLSAYAIDAAPGGAVGAASGTLRTVIDIAFITAPVVTGLIVERSGLGYVGGLGFAGILLVAATLVFVAARRRRAKA